MRHNQRCAASGRPIAPGTLRSRTDLAAADFPVRPGRGAGGGSRARQGSSPVSSSPSAGRRARHGSIFAAPLEAHIVKSANRTVPAPNRPVTGRHRASPCRPERQRVAPRLGQDLVPRPRIQRPAERRVQQRLRVLPRQAIHRKLRQSRRVLPPGSAPRAPRRQSRAAAVAPRTREPAPRPGPATARHRPGRSAAALRLSLTAAPLAPRAPSGTGPAPDRR
jgi:hypothetical protein